ncbi:putative NAD dependent epimerase/dehydratase [Trematosphaeria pertusa]|uniref:Putative NAD dependent epimerase/dehydratase n=1 Tax=Trematosphaeria pertusa TaxID=390896 RepID=A0A6A6IYI2_9PLEO|nr:putative NAD dependent epimerase/dehydratase [Trematosphaeria pertusa]KAF2255396.1 putative NAD dependent epimerase/dehydratase [Trematosphaeria pertusa]
MSGQTIFITGGSGYIGSTIIEKAITEGYKITALSRTKSSDEKLKKLGAMPVRGDLATHDVLTREAAKADIVINVADALAGDYSMPQEQRFAINNAAVGALAEGMKGNGKPLVLTSGSLIVAPDPEGKETDETSPPWPTGPFRQFKELMDGRNLEYMEQGIRVCSVRLAPYVYGRGGSGVALFMKRFAATGGAFYVDEGSARTTTVHVEDAARLYLLVAQKGRAGEAYNATFETDVTQRQIAEAIAKQLGLACPSMPKADLEATMGPFFATFLSAENRASNKKAKEELGWEVRAEKGILDEIATGSYVEVAKGLKKPSD